jgi:hypothetical protein
MILGRQDRRSKTSHRHKLEKSLVWSQRYVRMIAHRTSQRVFILIGVLTLALYRRLLKSTDNDSL